MQVVLLDVGHGNCAIVRDGSAAAVVDSPTGAILLDTLRELSIDTVDVAVISHADKDHIAGILSLLTRNEIAVRKIYLNPDSQRTSKIWRDFRAAVTVAERKGRCEIVASLSAATPGTIVVGNARISVISPTTELALTGVGGTTLSGRVLNANSLSGVLRVDNGAGGRGVLLAGDIDEVGLSEALAAGVELSADVLVFPHHGGAPGNADHKSFTNKLLDAVGADTVVFSNGRDRHDNPRSEIVEVVRSRPCSVICTQLSRRCESGNVDATPYLEPLRASGRRTNACCAGSITVDLTPRACRATQHASRHQKFITDLVATPMCRQR